MKVLFIDGPAMGRVVEFSGDKRNTHSLQIPVRDAVEIPTLYRTGESLTGPNMEPMYERLTYYQLVTRDLPFNFVLFSCSSVPLKGDQWLHAMNIIEWTVSEDQRKKDRALAYRFNTIENQLAKVSETLTNVMNNHRLSADPPDQGEDCEI